ncbi:hypothetical protein scyTo_0011961 [Scyliorhinus torazame]|uniref:Uncharacterized protein n=1 Tax=Scyliorhinus torazame TaxID=75743 RepID=A0A401NZ64_SCYTO|nr:hypothetical protein [Scyliorhinus torazame]
MVSVNFGQQSTQLPVMMVTGEEPSLLGCDRLKEIKLNWSEIFHVSEWKLPERARKYEIFFCDGLKSKDYKLRFMWIQRQLPRFFKARSVPYVLREKVDIEVNRLEKHGIIQPVSFSE